MSWPCWKHLSVIPAGEKCPASELYANRRLLEERESGAAGTDRSQPPKTLPKADEENVREALWVHLVQAKACPIRRIQVVRRIVIACRSLPNSEARDRITRVTRKIT